MSNDRLKTSLCMQIENLVDVLIQENLDAGERFILSYAFAKMHNFYCAMFKGMELKQVVSYSLNEIILDICTSSDCINNRNAILLSKSVIVDSASKRTDDAYAKCYERTMKDPNGYGSVLQLVAITLLNVENSVFNNLSDVPSTSILEGFFTLDCDYDSLVELFRSYKELRSYISRKVGNDSYDEFLREAYKSFKYQATGSDSFMGSLKSLQSMSRKRTPNSRVNTLVSDMEKLIWEYLSQTGVSQELANDALMALAKKLEEESYGN